MSIRPQAHYRQHQPLLDRISTRDKFKILYVGYRKMIDQLSSNSKDLGDMLRFLPGVVVQKDLSIKGMAGLYRIKPEFLARFIKSTELLRPSHPRSALDDCLFGFLQDRDRSQLYYCDPILQHIAICQRFLSFLDGSNVFDHDS